MQTSIQREDHQWLLLELRWKMKREGFQQGGILFAESQDEPYARFISDLYVELTQVGILRRRRAFRISIC